MYQVKQIINTIKGTSKVIFENDNLSIVLDVIKEKRLKEPSNIFCINVLLDTLNSTENK